MDVRSLIEDEDVYILWRIRKTTLEMCHDRGYLVPAEKLHEDFETFRAQNNKELVVRDTLNYTVNRGHQRLFVAFPNAPKIGIKDLKMLIDRMRDEGTAHCILVTEQSLTPSANQLVKDVVLKYTFEHFLRAQMMFNVTQHALVPKHIPLTSEQKAKLLAQYNLTENQLPSIRKDEPVCRYFGLKRGTVLKIQYNSKASGEYYKYRVVV